MGQTCGAIRPASRLLALLIALFFSVSASAFAFGPSGGDFGRCASSSSSAKCRAANRPVHQRHGGRWRVTRGTATGGPPTLYFSVLTAVEESGGQRTEVSVSSGGEDERRPDAAETAALGGSNGNDGASSSSRPGGDEDPPPFPSKTSLNAELTRLAKRGDADGARALLDSAEDWYQRRRRRSAQSAGQGVDGEEVSGRLPHPIPDATSYGTVIECMAKSGEDDSIALAEELLGKMNRLSDDSPDRRVKPNRAVYGVVMNAVAGMGRSSSTSNDDDDNVDPVARCEALLSEMRERYESHRNALCKPDATHYNCLLKAIANSGRRDSGVKAEAVLDGMWAEYADAADESVKPNAISYCTTISSWARSHVGGKGARRGERLLEKMEELSSQDPAHGDLRPTSFAVNAVLNAWAKSNRGGSAARAEVILKRMEDLYMGGREELRPSAISYNTVISAYARSEDRGAERRAEFLLRRMAALSTNETTRDAFADCEPDIISYNTVINCWARSAVPYSARRAEAILRHVDRQFAAGKSSVAPDVTTYTSVINAWSRSKEPDAAHRADSILRRMEQVSKDGDNPMAKPNVLTYNTVLNCWAKCRDECATDKALDILVRMERSYEAGESDVKPDVFSYTSCIDALAKRDSIEAAKKANELLNKMEDIYNRTGDRDLKPNIRTYTSIINSITRSKQEPERAESILRRMEELFEKGDKDVQPDVVCFNAVINAYAWSADPLKAIKGGELYRHMKELYESGKNVDAKPDLISCNTLLNACAYTPLNDKVDNAEVVDIAIKTLEGVQAASPDFGRPNQITYATMLLAITNLLPVGDLRDSLAKSVFWQACQDGQVSTFVVSNLLHAATENTLKELLGDALTLSDNGPKYDFKRLPEQWTRFGGGRKSRPSRKKRPAQGIKRPSGSNSRQ